MRENAVPGRRNALQKRHKTTFLPEAVQSFLKKRTVEAVGLVFWALFVATVLSLLSYNQNDPSWQHATTVTPVNWLGLSGAYAADLLLQTLGAASAVLVLPLASWGWRIFSHQGLPWIWRHVVCLPLAVTTAVIFAAHLPSPAIWPVESGLGGYLGLTLLANLKSLLVDWGLGFYPWAIAPLFAVMTLFLMVHILGLSRVEWQIIGKGILWCCRKIWQGVSGAAVFLYMKIIHPNKDEKAKAPVATPAPSAGAKKEPLLGKLRARKEDRLSPPRTARPATGRKNKKSSRVVEANAKVKASRREERERQPLLDMGIDGEYKLPPLGLLAKPEKTDKQGRITEDALEQNARMLESVLDDFGVQGDIVQVRPGPVVTLYELEPAPGTKSSRVIGLADDIAQSMSAVSARVAVVPGRNAIGIELPNSKREMVALREVLSTPEYENTNNKLALALGKDIGGQPVYADLATMPHLLVAGTTGSGKSVAINTMILSLVYRLSPAQCRFIMVDPKMLELSVYDGIPHLLTPVVTDPKKAVVALKWAVREMEDRYSKMSKLGVRNITAYNKRVEQAQKKGEPLTRKVQVGFDKETGEPLYEEERLDLKPLPMIVIIVDEMADLMLVAGKDIEALVQRLAQMARAAGLHLIMATQRPSVDVITGTIKANFPTRMSFQVTSKIDSRTILGEQGAEQLLGKGDMLYMAGGGRITRVHAPFVSDENVEEVVAELKKNGQPDYLEDVTEEPEDGFDSTFLEHSSLSGGDKSSGDEMYDRAVAIVARDRKASTSYIQRQLQIGYNRAANIIERMEREGVVSTANHAGKRDVLVGDHSGGENNF